MIRKDITFGKDRWAPFVYLETSFCHVRLINTVQRYFFYFIGQKNNKKWIIQNRPQPFCQEWRPYDDSQLRRCPHLCWSDSLRHAENQKHAPWSSRYQRRCPKGCSPWSSSTLPRFHQSLHLPPSHLRPQGVRWLANVRMFLSNTPHLIAIITGSDFFLKSLWSESVIIQRGNTNFCRWHFSFILHFLL